MWPFRNSFFYVQVCFLRGKHPCTYKTTDRSIRINTVVMVPAGAEIKPAIVTGIGLCPGEKLPCAPEDIREVIGKVGWRERRLFKGIDMRVPHKTVKNRKVPESRQDLSWIDEMAFLDAIFED